MSADKHRNALPPLWHEKPRPTTFRGWLETLPDGYRERALGQCLILGCKVDSLIRAIAKFSKWKDAKEGGLFWLHVYDWSRGLGDLPPLPADPPEVPIVATLGAEVVTIADDLVERIAIAIAPAIIAEWSYNNEDLPAEIAKLAKAIAGEFRK